MNDGENDNLIERGPGEEKDGERVLRVIPSGPRDSALDEGLIKEEGSSASKGGELAAQAQSKPGTGSHRRRGEQDVQGGEEKLPLPKGGLVVMRKSGGLKFSTQQVVVYKDGRVVSVVGAGGASKERKLTDAQLAELYRTLDGVDFLRMASTIGRQNPDAFAYEIATRIGRTVRNIEVFDGSIPESVASLIKLLRQYM